MNLIKKSEEVYLAQDDITSISQVEMNFLKSALHSAPRGRVRINLHPSNEDKLHEMFIVLDSNTYIRPHKHPEKSEAFHVVYGAARIIIFHDDGSIYRVVDLKAGCDIKPFYYRMSKPYYHTLIIESDMIILHEITNGPFNPSATLFASFSPVENDIAAIKEYQDKLNQQLIAWKNPS